MPKSAFAVASSLVFALLLLATGIFKHRQLQPARKPCVPRTSLTDTFTSPPFLCLSIEKSSSSSSLITVSQNSGRDDSANQSQLELLQLGRVQFSLKPLMTPSVPTQGLASLEPQTSQALGLKNPCRA